MCILHCAQKHIHMILLMCIVYLYELKKKIEIISHDKLGYILKIQFLLTDNTPHCSFPFSILGFLNNGSANRISEHHLVGLFSFH